MYKATFRIGDSLLDILGCWLIFSPDSEILGYQPMKPISSVLEENRLTSPASPVKVATVLGPAPGISKRHPSGEGGSFEERYHLSFYLSSFSFRLSISSKRIRRFFSSFLQDGYSEGPLRNINSCIVHLILLSLLDRVVPLPLPTT